jgi:hypothetical protein
MNKFLTRRDEIVTADVIPSHSPTNSLNYHPSSTKNPSGKAPGKPSASTPVTPIRISPKRPGQMFEHVSVSVLAGHQKRRRLR